MKFVIVGYGRVGARTARILKSEGHDVTIVENDPDKAAEATRNEFEVVEGDGEDEAVLERAGLAEADALGGLTGDLNANFTACIVAKTHDARTVLRIDEDYREEIYAKYTEDVDEIVYPERLGAAGAKNALLGGDLNALADVTEQLTAATLAVPDGSPLVGKRVVEVELPGDARIYAHGRDREPMVIPLPRTTVEVGDRLAFIADQAALEEVHRAVSG